MEKMKLKVRCSPTGTDKKITIINLNSKITSHYSDVKLDLGKLS